MMMVLRENASDQLSPELEMGDCFRENGDLREALNSYQRALSIALAQFGPEHPLVASARNRTGDVQQELGDLKNARQEFEQALTIDTSAYGSSHPVVARDLNN